MGHVVVAGPKAFGAAASADTGAPLMNSRVRPLGLGATSARDRSAPSAGPWNVNDSCTAPDAPNGRRLRGWGLSPSAGYRGNAAARAGSQRIAASGVRQSARSRCPSVQGAQAPPRARSTAMIAPSQNGAHRSRQAAIRPACPTRFPCPPDRRDCQSVRRLTIPGGPGQNPGSDRPGVSRPSRRGRRLSVLVKAWAWPGRRGCSPHRQAQAARSRFRRWSRREP